MSRPRRLTEVIGGRKILGRDLRTDRDIVALVRRGVPPAVVRYLIEHDILSAKEVEQIVMPRRTLAHRTQARQPLTKEESDRLLRVARIIAMAEDTFADREKAKAWLRRPNRVLGDATPLSLLDSDAGVRSVETLLGRIAHGLAA